MPDNASRAAFRSKRHWKLNQENTAFGQFQPLMPRLQRPTFRISRFRGTPAPPPASAPSPSDSAPQTPTRRTPPACAPPRSQSSRPQCASPAARSCLRAKAMSANCQTGSDTRAKDAYEESNAHLEVLLDADLAMLYDVETGALNRAVKRNIERFPADFMLQLSPEEWEDLKCQIGISSSSVAAAKVKKAGALRSTSPSCARLCNCAA